MARPIIALLASFLAGSLLLLGGCDSAPTPTSVTGISDSPAVVDTSSVFVELRVTTDHGNFSSTLTSEMRVQADDAFGPSGGAPMFSVVEVTNSQNAVVELLATAEKYTISENFIAIEHPERSDQEFQLRTLKVQKLNKVAADKKANIDRLQKIAERVTVDDVGSVQEVVFKPGLANDKNLSFATRFKNLRKIVGPRADISHQSISSLKTLKRLRELDFSGSYVGQRELAAIAEIESLETLVLNDATVSHRDIQAVTKIEQLRYLSLKGASISTSVFWSLQRNMPECVVVGESKLKWGVLRTATGEKSVVDLAGDAELEHESAARANALLMGVNLVENQAGDVIAADASRHSEHSPTQAANAIYALRAFYQLKQVDLSYSDCGGGGLAEIKHLATNGLNNNLEPILLEELNLSGVKAPVESWYELYFQYRLKRLDLSHTNINDEGVRRLRSLKSLEQLKLEGVNVATSTIEYLAARLPDTKIIH